MRYYSTSIQTTAWQERAGELGNAAMIARKLERHNRREVARAAALRNYWSQFPSDAVVAAHAEAVKSRLKLQGTLYVAMKARSRLIFGVAAPPEGLRHPIPRTFIPTPFVKIDLQRFFQMKQRGEIITGGPHRNRLMGEAPCDWTGAVW